MPARHILVTGFEPFAGDTGNPLRELGGTHSSACRRRQGAGQSGHGPGPDRAREIAWLAAVHSDH